MLTMAADLGGSMERLKLLLREHSYREGLHTLASGTESDFYIDCKATLLLAEGHELAARLMLERIQADFAETVGVAGVALGGCSLASAVAMLSVMIHLDRPLDAIYVRKAAKDHGTSSLIEGGNRLPVSAPIVLLEDVVTTGGSSLRAVAALESRFSVLGVIALVDREEGAGAAFMAAGMPLVSIYSRDDFVQS